MANDEYIIEGSPVESNSNHSQGFTFVCFCLLWCCLSFIIICLIIICFLNIYNIVRLKKDPEQESD